MSRERRRKVARAGVVGAAALGLVLAGIQGLQSLSSSFNPRWEVTALFVLAGIAATFWVQRVAERHAAAEAAEQREEALRSHLCEWPVGLLADSPPGRLGVFPHRRSTTAPYVKRDLDQRLTTALADPAPLLLIGDARAGKSRTAWEVARAAVPAARVIVPRGADGLRGLLEADDPPLTFDGEQTVLWLDGVERFVDAVNGEMLDELRRNRVAVVATVRTGTWDKLLATDGQKSEAARALAARARVFVLPARLSGPEARRAAPLYRGWRLDNGLGRAVATVGHEGADPPPPPPPPVADAPEVSAASSALRDPWITVPAAVCGAALAIIAALALVGEFEEPATPTLAQQIHSARRDVSAGSLDIIDQERVDFRGAGEQSLVLVSGNRGTVPRGRVRSDQLLVYNVQGEKLVRALSFQPRTAMGESGPEAWVFRFRGIADIDGDGAEELVGGYGTSTTGGEQLVPFAVDWDEDDGRYRLVPLLPERPELSIEPVGLEAAGLRGKYVSPTKLTAVRGLLSIEGYRVQDFTVVTDPHQFVAGFVSRIMSGGLVRAVELSPFLLDRSGRGPRLTPCRLMGRELPVRPLPVRPIPAPQPNVRQLQFVIREEWLAAREKAFCVPVP